MLLMNFTSDITFRERERESGLSSGNGNHSYIACSDKQYYSYSSQLGKSWVMKSQKYVCGQCHFLCVFRRLLAIQPSDFDGAAQLNRRALFLLELEG